MSTDLYTSQVHLKRLLAGQATAAFTPAPETVLKVLDPAFFPGMGALNEDGYGRIQCPVRGCGIWVTSLGHHAKRHKAIGGAAGIRRALDMPKGQTLMSASARALLPKAPHLTQFAYKKGHADLRGARSAAMARTGKKITVAQRNWADTCPAQLANAFASLAVELGHSPSLPEAERKFGTGIKESIQSVFGSWNNAKAAAGLETQSAGDGPNHKIQRDRKKRVLVGLCVDSLREWYDAHGDLPAYTDAATPSVAPRLPRPKTIMSVLGAKNWPAAMQSAIKHLGITSERYGTPSRKSA